MTDQQLHLYCETVADIAYDMGYRRLRISNDSRERIGRIVQWAREFNEMHKDTDWNRKDYIETVEEFTNSNLRAYFANINRCCPQCGEAAALHCEFIYDQPDYFSLQCYRCGQYWESTDALVALSGVKKWEKEIIGEDARAVLKTLRLDVEPDRQLYGRLEHPASYCRGVYQDRDKFVAFDNTRGECMIEEFSMLNTAILWIRGEIQASDRFKYE